MVSSFSSSSSTSDNSDAESVLPHLLQVQTEPAAPTVVHGINIQSRVPLVLDFNDANYVAWARSFSAVFGQYGLRDHVDGTPAKGGNDWVQNDCAIVSWFYNRISPELLSMVSGDADTAYSLWRGVCNLFRDNKDTRAVYLGAEFRNFYQGDLPVLDYCSKMKVMADRLAGLGALVNDKDLIYNIVRGLNPRLHHAIPHITLRRRLPSFLKTRSMLQLEEHRIAESEKMQAAAALVAQAATASSTSSSAPPAAPTAAHIQAAATFVAHAAPNAHPSQGTGAGKQPATFPAAPASGGHSFQSSSNAKKKKKKGAPSSQAPPPGFWPSMNPWTGMVQAWPFQAPRAPTAGVLGPRPPATTPQAHVAGASSPLDPQLLATLNNISLHQPQSTGEWFFDTGTSSHMSQGSGSTHPGGDSPQ
ncbi:uncharacterized protein LOC133895828 [Phragmites australis]|uniref:uncharacterized protein LOC133895828 n=1 Tax=Phragmites australis TaxID=29695 RepID=UPI002D78353C|nr:uncharacterized protein LOC133895828 [Phragmites australis]